MIENGDTETLTDKDLEVVEVNFARSNMDDIPHLEKLNEIFEEYNSNEKEISSSYDFNLKQELF